MTFDKFDNFDFVVETLTLIDVDFKIISFLQMIIVEMYNDELNVNIKKKEKSRMNNFYNKTNEKIEHRQNFQRH